MEDLEKEKLEYIYNLLKKFEPIIDELLKKYIQKEKLKKYIGGKK